MLKDNLHIQGFFKKNTNENETSPYFTTADRGREMTIAYSEDFSYFL